MGLYNGKYYNEGKTNAQIDCPSCGRVVPFGGWHVVVESDSKRFCSLVCFKEWADMNSPKTSSHDDSYKKQELERKTAEIDRTLRDTQQREKLLREEERRLEEYEERVRKDEERRCEEDERRQEEYERQKEELEEKERERQEKMRLDYCGYCHNPVLFDFEEISINGLFYRIHKSCWDSFNSSNSEIWLKWQDSLREEKEKEEREKREFEKQRLIVEKWLTDTKEGIEELEKIKLKNWDEKTRIKYLFKHKQELQREKDITRNKNEEWIRNTPEGKSFNEQCTEMDKDVRLRLIERARYNYELEQVKLKKEEERKELEEKKKEEERKNEERNLQKKKKELLDKISEFISKTEFYFDKKTKEKVDDWINNQLENIKLASDVVELERFNNLLNVSFEILPRRKRLLHFLRVCFDIYMVVFLGGTGLAYIYLESDIKKAIIFSGLALFFLASPIIGKKITNNQIKKTNSSNIQKINTIMGELII